MKLFSVLLSILLIALLVFPTAGAQCFDLRLAKSSYLAGETLQAEITGNLLRALTYNAISFSYNGQEYFPAITLQQIASNKWIIFGDVKEKYGLNELAVSKVLCRDNGTLKEETIKISFSVKKPIQNYFTAFQDRINWFDLSTDEVSQSIMALSDFSESENGKKELLKRGEECWPSEKCSVKSTVLAILALNDANKTEEAKKWITDSQNSVDIGIWKLITTSFSEQQCNLSINNQNSSITVSVGTNELPLELPDSDTINISLDCPLTARISHTYLGVVHEFYLGTINNKKCWGKNYRTNCDTLSTAYALQIIEDSEAEKWLSENAKTTQEAAYANYYTKDSKLSDWLVNNQHTSGYWSISSLAISNKSDVFSTLAAIKSLGGNSKAEKWLVDNFDSFSLEEQAAVLQILKEKIEPLVSIQAGFIKASSSQNATLKVSNKGIFPVELKATLQSSSESLIIPAKTALPLTIKVPSVSELIFLSIDLNYMLKAEERTYSIPIAIMPAGQEINLINQSISGGTIKAANFQFSELIVNETLNYGEEKTINLSIKNSGDAATVDITLWGISNVISSIPVSVELKANSVTILPVTFRASDLNYYSGQITLESGGNSASIPVYISTKQTVSEKSCSELKGQICPTECLGNLIITPEGNCCIGECKKIEAKGFSMKTIGIIMIVLAVLVAALFLFFKLKKPKKKQALEKVLAKIKEESKIHEVEEKPKV